MIVVTGPGRSGTSLVAALYRELGFDPGGTWNPAIRAGYEAPDVVAANVAIARALGIAGPGREPPRILPEAARDRIRSRTRNVPWFSARRLRLARWSRVPELVAAQGERLRSIAGAREVGKDPRFCFTLAVWAAARAPIEQVVIATRALDRVAASRAHAGHHPAGAADASRNLAAYALGMVLAAALEHGLPYAVVRYPEFAERPDELYDVLRFPAPVSRERFLAAARAVVDPALIHRDG